MMGFYFFLFNEKNFLLLFKFRFYIIVKLLFKNNIKTLIFIQLIDLKS